jgi:hypothetical protein
MLNFWPSRPKVNLEHVNSAVKRAKAHPKGTPEHNAAWKKADAISKEYYMQTSVHNYGSDVWALVQLLEELDDLGD